MAHITTDGYRTKIDGFSIEDAAVAELLQSRPEAEAEALVTRALSVGAAGLMNMGVAVDVDAIGAKVNGAVAAQLAGLTDHIDRSVHAIDEAVSVRFDPARPESFTSRLLADLAALKEELETGLSLDHRASRAAALLDGIERAVVDALDPDSSSSGIGRAGSGLRGDVQQLRDTVVASRAQHEEAARGTAKGTAFEDLIEERVRSALRGRGAIVRRVSEETGALSSTAKVGDIMIEYETGSRVVMECKNTGSISLGGSGGILTELDAATANRNAAVGICVSASNAFPNEVGGFGIYGNHILVVDAGDGLLLEVALRCAELLTAAADRQRGDLDAATVASLIARIRRPLDAMSNLRRSLKASVDSIEAVREEVTKLRRDALELVDEALAALERSA